MKEVTKKIFDAISKTNDPSITSNRIVLIDRDVIVYCRGDGGYNITDSSDFYRATKVMFNRETVIDAFSLVETLCAEIKIMKKYGYMGVSPEVVDNEYRVFFKDKIGCLRDWGLVDDPLKKHSMELAFVRNRYAHSLYVGNVLYWGMPLNKDSLLQETFRQDLVKVYEQLMDVLHKVQKEKGFDSYLSNLVSQVS